jgi:acyl-CoA thioester hydrolase
MAHEARIRYLSRLGYSEIDVGGCGIIMADAAIVFRSEAFYGQSVRIQIATELAGRTGCDFFYRMTDTKDEREIAIVKTGIVFFDYDKRRPTRIPKLFRAAISNDD